MTSCTSVTLPSKVSFSPAGFIDLLKGDPDYLNSGKYSFSALNNKSITIILNDGTKISGIIARALMYGDEVIDYKTMNGKIIRELRGYKPCSIIVEPRDSSWLSEEPDISVAFSKGKTLYSRAEEYDYEDNVSTISLDLNEIVDVIPALKRAFKGVFPALMSLNDTSGLGESLCGIIAEYTFEIPTD